VASRTTAAALCFSLFAGTGGYVQQEQLVGLMGTGSFARGPVESAQQDIADQLEVIRTTLRLSVAELADILRVSRPTIYSWRSGGNCTADNARKVRTIAAALAPHAAVFCGEVGRVTRRTIEGRSSLIDLLRADRDPVEVFDMLAAGLRWEAAQKERLAQRLQGKTGSRGKPDADVLG